MAGTSSRAGGRISAALSRFRDGSRPQSKSRRSSLVLTSVENSHAAFATGPKSPIATTSPQAVVAPWAADYWPVDKAPERSQINHDGRIGFLPSPVLDTYMTLDNQPIEEDSASGRESGEKAQSPRAAGRDRLDVDPPRWGVNSQPQDSFTKMATPAELSKCYPAEKQNDDLDKSQVSELGQAQAQCMNTIDLGRPATDDISQSLVSQVGSVVRSPRERPSYFTDVHPVRNIEVEVQETVSSVPIFGPHAGEGSDIDRNQSTDVSGVASPVKESAVERDAESFSKNAQSAPQEQELKPLVVSSITAESNGSTSQKRPETGRKTSRSNLPSQQRPILESRRSSYGGWGSRRASQVLEPATEGVVTPRFGSRRNSIERFQGYGDSPTDQRFPPVSPQGGYFTAEDLCAATASNLSTRSPYLGHDPMDSTTDASASSTVMSVETNPLHSPSKEPLQQYEYTQPPVTANSQPQMYYHQYNYPQQPIIADDPLTPRQEDFQANHSNPVSQDPRQLVGAGSLEDVPQRGSFRDRRSSVQSVQAHSASNSQSSAAMTDPTTVSRPHQTPAGNDSSRAPLEKKDKGKPGIFRAFSRSRNNSTSDSLHTRVPSRSGMSTQSVPGIPESDKGQQQQQQSQRYSDPASQKLGVNPTLRNNTLKKVHRSATTTVAPDPEKKEKRFSRLGSIFGRRNSPTAAEPKAAEPKRGNRLSKPMPRTKSQTPSKSITPRQGSGENLSGYSTPRPEQINLPLSPPPAEVQAQYQHQRAFQPGTADPSQSPSGWNAPAPPGGWYAPTGRSSSYTERQRQKQQFTEPMLPLLEPTAIAPVSPVPTTRRLHSEGFRREPRYLTASPGPGSVANGVPAPQERYLAGGGQAIAPGSKMPEQLDASWEQTISPTMASRAVAASSAPLSIPRGHRDQRNPPAGYNSGPPQRPLSGAWQRQHSYGSDSGGYYFDNFSSYGTSPTARRKNSIGSDNRITPTHSRSASFGAAPKENYRMSNPIEDEEMLQRHFEQMRAQEAAYYNDGQGGAYPLQTATTMSPTGGYEAKSASSSPYKTRDPNVGWYGPPSQRSTTPGNMYFSSPTMRQPLGAWQQQQQPPAGPTMAVSPSARPPSWHIRTPSGSRTNSLKMINEDYPFPITEPMPSPPLPTVVKAGTGTVQSNRPARLTQSQSYYNANAERRRMERRESGFPATATAAGY